MTALYVAVLDYEVLTEFFKTLTDEKSYSVHEDSDKFQTLVDWINSNVIWVEESQIDPTKQVVFKTYANITGHPDIDPKEFEVGCNVYGFRGKGLLTQHIMELPLCHVYENVSETHNAEYGKCDALIEFSTDGTCEGTRLYSILFREVLSLVKREE